MQPTGRQAALLAAWGSAWLAGSVGLDEAVAAVSGEPDRHTVDWPGSADPLGLDQLLGRLRLAGTRRLRLALPAPGDPAGVPAGGSLAPAALAAGAAVLTEGAVPECGLVPTVTAPGPAEEGTASVVVWSVHPQPAAPPPPAGGGLAEAAGELRGTVRDATATLTRLDLARWRPELAAALASRRSESATSRPGLRLPRGYPERARDLADLAVRLAGVAELAAADPSGALTGAEMRERAETLRALAGAARRACVAAVNAGPLS